MITEEASKLYDENLLVRDRYISEVIEPLIKKHAPKSKEITLPMRDRFCVGVSINFASIYSKDYINIELTKGKEKLRVKKVNDDSIFIKYGLLTFLCDFELKKLEFIFKTDVPITSPTPAKANSLLNSLNKFKEPYVQLGYQVAHIEFIYIPNNEEEIKSVLKEIIDNYS